jgi:hypothetical protein
VDFVVGDYNHANLGDEHVQVTRATGGFEPYLLQWESGDALLYPDGVTRAGDWTANDVVRVWDVPLFGGENVLFRLQDTGGGSLDLGMALFASDGTAAWSGRDGAVRESDDVGPGGAETFSFPVPADDVYGLVVWTNQPTAGSFDIRIGPVPVTLAEETPFFSSYDLRLFDYEPNAAAWAVIGSRPEPTGDIALSLYDDASYREHLATSDSQDGSAASGVELIAVDYALAPLGADHLRVVDHAGGSHRTEWEHDDDLVLDAAVLTTWDAEHVCKVWSAPLVGGVPYFFRSYSTGLDTGLYLFESSPGEPYRARAEAVAGSDAHGPADDGEWFRHTSSESRWAGLVQVVHDGSAGTYSLWVGPDVALVPGAPMTLPQEIAFATVEVTSDRWHAIAARPGEPTDEIAIWLYGDEGCSASALLAADETGLGLVNFAVGDAAGEGPSALRSRFRRQAGGDAYEVAAAGAEATLAPPPGEVVEAAFDWAMDEVVKVFDVGLTAGVDVRIRVEPGAAELDLNAALFAPTGARQYLDPTSARATAASGGPGAAEEIAITPETSGVFGLVITAATGAGGSGVVRVGDAAAVSADPALAGVPTRFSFAVAPNPFPARTELVLSLPRADVVELAVYDVTGRLVRSIVSGPLDAGTHRSVWDGRDESGRPAAAGVYLARLRTPTREEVLKVVRSR